MHKEKHNQTIDIKLFSWGPVKHPQGDFTVDRDFFKELKDSHDRLSSEGYYAPILKQHTEDGYSRGRVSDVYENEEGIGVKVLAPEVIIKMIKDGLIDYWSPSFFTDRQDPHSDHIFKKVLRELSFVSIPHLKNVGSQSPYYALTEQSLTHSLSEYFDTEAVNNMDNTEMEEMFNKIFEILDRLEAKLTPEDEPEESPEDVEMAEEVVALRETVKTLTKNAVEAEIKTELGEVDESVKTVLHSLSETDRVVMITSLKSVTKSTEVGSPGVAAAPPASELFSLCESAKKSGIKRGPALLKHLQANGQDIASLDFSVIGKVFS